MNESTNKQHDTGARANPVAASWEPLPSGTLTQLQSRIHRRNSRRQFIRMASVVGVLTAAGGATYLYLVSSPSNNREYRYAGLTCYEAMIAVPDVIAGKAPDALADQVRRHIDECAACRAHFPEYPKLG